MSQVGGSRESGRALVVVLLAVLVVVAGGVGYAVWSWSAKPRPLDGLPDTSTVAEACAERGYFPAAAPHDGSGPAPVRIAIRKEKEGAYGGEYESLLIRPVPGQRVPATLNPTRNETAELIACLDQTGVGEQVETCRFDSASDEIPMYEATYDVTVYEARTGEQVGRTALADAEQALCPAMLFVGDGETKLYTEPSARQLDDALSEFTS
ncbi:hypothetical protein [Actinopolymorpha sp. B9G3]|uniref:hypothetical protein n=1 Tax=Actinopolymorpha sp. B9G3 TaxID=3158970 RepID=UPI0032D8E5C8